MALNKLLLLLLSILNAKADHFQTSFLTKFIEESPSSSTVGFYCDEQQKKALLNIFVILSKKGRQFEAHDLNTVEITKEITEKFFKEAGRKQQTDIILNLNCRNISLILRIISDLEGFTSYNNFIVFGDDLNSTIDEFSRVNSHFGSQIIFVFKENSSTFSLYKLMNRKLLNDFRLQPFGNFSEKYGLQQEKLDTPVKNLRTRNFLTGNVASVCVLASDYSGKVPFLHYIHDGSLKRDHRDGIHRFGVQLINVLAEFYNLSIHWVRGKSLTITNRSESECLGQLDRKEVNFSASAITFNPTKLRVADSGLGISKQRQLFIFRHPKYGKGIGLNRDMFMEPLSQEVWLATLFTFILLLAIFYFIHVYERLQDPSVDPASFGTAFVSSVAAFAQQGISEQFNSLHAKITILISMISSFLIFQFYTAYIVGSLLMPPVKTLTTLEKLRATDLRYALEDTVNTDEIFSNTTSDTMEEFYQFLMQKKTPRVSLNEGVDMVKKGSAVFFTFLDNAYDIVRRTFTPTEMDEIQEVSAFQNTIHSILYFPIAKGSPYKEFIRVGVQKLRDTGVASYWLKRWQMSQPVGDLAANLETSVDLEHFATILYLLAASMVISVFILFFEFIKATFISNGRLRKLMRRIRNVKRIPYDQRPFASGIIRE